MHIETTMRFYGASVKVAETEDQPWDNDGREFFHIDAGNVNLQQSLWKVVLEALKIKTYTACMI